MVTPAELHPLEKANVHNTSVTAATDILATAISLSYPVTMLRILCSFSVVGIFSARVTKATVAVSTQFNNGITLTANTLWMFDMLVHEGDTVNFRYSVNATMLLLRVQEIPVASQ